MFIDARSLADGAALEADLCIVGAGAAGITIALVLMESGLRVLLLESGGLDFDDRTQRLYRGTMSGIDSFTLDGHRWRYFGGSTNRWAGWCMPLGPEDFAPRPYIPMSGWPIAYDDLEPYYRRAHERVELGPFDWDAAEMAARADLPLLPSATGLLATRLFRYSPPTRFNGRYRDRVAAARDLTAVLRANVVGVAIGGGGVSHLECRALDGPSFTVEADRYVLAMGGLENARILLASGDPRAGGIANSSGLVGRCFMEHPHLYESAGWLAFGDPDPRFYLTRRSPDGPDQQRGVLALAREIRDAEGLPDFTISFHEEAADGARTGEIPASHVRGLWRQDERARFYRMTLRAEQTPYPESRLTLRESSDELGVPELDLDWRVRDEDRRAYRRGMEILGRELGAAGLGRIWTPRDADGRLAHAIKPGGHHMGMTRMSERPEDGVVDRNCRCHDLDNLFVAGSSVFTTGGSANPTLTIVALAERLAAHLSGGES